MIIEIEDRFYKVAKVFLSPPDRNVIGLCPIGMSHSGRGPGRRAGERSEPERRPGPLPGGLRLTGLVAMGALPQACKAAWLAPALFAFRVAALGERVALAIPGFRLDMSAATRRSIVHSQRFSFWPGPVVGASARVARSGCTRTPSNHFAPVAPLGNTIRVRASCRAARNDARLSAISPRRENVRSCRR